MSSARASFGVATALLLSSCDGIFAPECPASSAIGLIADGVAGDDVSGRATFVGAERFPATDTVVWRFTVDDAALELQMSTSLEIPEPDPTTCCDIFLPREKLSSRTEVRLSADDGLWLEVSSPTLGEDTPGMHTSIASEDAVHCVLSGGPREVGRRRPVKFSFSDDDAFLGERRTGAIDGVAVVGIVTDDSFVRERVPQAVVHRP